MLKKITTFLILIGIVGLVTQVWGADFQEGRYEITSTVKMPGMPMQPPPTTITECLTPQDPVPNQSAADANCKILDMKTQGNTVTWKMECNQQGQEMKSSGKMVYHGDRFEGTVDTVMGAQAGNMEMTTTINGKRIGACE